MSLDAQIGRVLMVAPPEGWVQGDTQWLDDLQPAGIILFRRNLPDDPEEARSAIARLQAWASKRGETLLIAMDEEGGFVTQISDYIPTPPSARALARAAGPEATRQVYQHYGARLRALGVNVDFAPVCDVNNNPLNPVIGVRSFAREVADVTAHSRAVHEGLQAAGVLSCAKHFPGHGDTDVDSHLALPIVQHDRHRFDAIELVPFRALLPDVPMVMMAHLACPEIGDGSLPATLSPAIATRLLREELGFAGVTITDSMEMEGVAKAFGFGESAALALNAGCDLLLYSFEIDSPLQARQGIRKALDARELSTERLQEAGDRVDRLRALAVALGDTPQAARPLPPFDEDLLLYRSLCRRSLQVTNQDSWAALAHDLRHGERLTLVSWHDKLARGLCDRLQERDIQVETTSLARAIAEKARLPLVVLVERRPLEAEVLRQFPEFFKACPTARLANMLTPEIDIGIRDKFDAYVQTADASGCMQDVFVEWLLQEGAA